MTKSNATETDILAKIFTATAIPWDAAGNLEIHLHTADPGEAGITTTSEATYTSYALVTVARTTGGWTVTGNTCANDNLIQFPQCTGGSNVLTHVSISPSGSTQILYSGALNASLTVTNGIQPQFVTSALSAVED
jgi:hypothetical protein